MARRLNQRLTVRLSPGQLAKLQEAAEGRGIEVSGLVRQLALQQLESNPITPDEAKNIVANAYEAAAVEVLPQYEPETSSLEDQLGKLSQTEGDLRARKSQLQTEKSELSRRRAESMRIGDADKAAALGREIADLEGEITAVEETLMALADTRRELQALIQERDVAIRERARELLGDALARAADAVDVKLKELAAALDSLAILMRETRPDGEDWAAWQSRLAAHLWDGIARYASTDEVREFCHQRRPWLMGFDNGQSLSDRLGVGTNRVLVS